MAIVAVGVFLVAYVLIATERVHKVKVVLGGAAVVLALGIVDCERRVLLPYDWNRLGRHLFAAGHDDHRRGVAPDRWLRVRGDLGGRARGRVSPLRVMILLVWITATASAVLPNVTIVLLMAPVTLLVCDRLDIDPVPFLIAEVLASNIGGVSTLIGDPPNIIIGSRAGLSFNDFLIHLAPLAIIAMIAFGAGAAAVVPRNVRCACRPYCRSDVAERARGYPRCAAAGQVRRRAGRR